MSYMYIIQKLFSLLSDRYPAMPLGINILHVFQKRGIILARAHDVVCRRVCIETNVFNGNTPWPSLVFIIRVSNLIRGLRLERNLLAHLNLTLLPVHG